MSVVEIFAKWCDAQPGTRFRFHINFEAIFRAGIGGAAPHAIDRTTARDRDQPAERFAERGGVALRFAPDMQHAFLQNIVGFRFILHHLVDDFFQHLLMPLNE